ncbi:MAG: tRNA epoxyqueuosine(34) reductase QueG [Elstera sp.]
MTSSPPSPSPKDGFRAFLREAALAQGFDAVGFAPASVPSRAAEALRGFLAEGRHGDMGWMDAHADRRADPQTLWPDARSVLVVGQNYAPGHDPLALLDRPERGAVSIYARNKDYHDLMKSRLRALAGLAMAEAARLEIPCDVKLFVDTAPVMEKPLAVQAGLGWQGKHTNMVSRDFGSWLFLGELFLSVDLAPGEAEADHCGRCTRCLSACPTAAFPAPYQLDARRCVAYLTIEHKGVIPADLRPLMGNRIYGCDDCLAVCPWNKFARVTREAAFFPRIELTAPRLAELAVLDDASFRVLFAGSPVKRTGRARFVRNVLIALGNSALPELAPVAEQLLMDESPLVRGMAVWALRRLAPARLDAHARLADTETDPEVQAEWARP